MKLVGVWKEGVSDLFPILLIKDQDFEDFKLHWICGEFEITPSYIFRLMPNGAGTEGAFLHYLYVSYAKQFDNAYQSPDLDTLTGLFFSNWEQIRECIKGNDWIDFGRASTNLIASCPVVFKEMGLLISFLNDFFNKFVRYYFDGAPYVDVDYSKWVDDWWQCRPNLETILDELIINVSGKHKRIDSVMRLSDRLASIKGQIAKLKAGVTKESLLVASAYCFILARAKAAIGHNSLALLFTHRSLDFYLQYQCLDKQLLKSSGFGRLDYVNSIQDKDMVTVSNSYLRLTIKEPLMAQDSRLNFLKMLNGKRNKLIQAHGMYGLVNEDVSTNCVEKAREEIESMDASNPAWKRIVKDLNPYLIISETLLFDIEDSFDSYLVRVKLGELEAG